MHPTRLAHLLTSDDPTPFGDLVPNERDDERRSRPPEAGGSVGGASMAEGSQRLRCGVGMGVVDGEKVESRPVTRSVRREKRSESLRQTGG